MPRLRKQDVCTEADQSNDGSGTQESLVVSVVQEVSQDGNGINTINTGKQGDVTNEPDSND